MILFDELDMVREKIKNEIKHLFEKEDRMKIGDDLNEAVKDQNTLLHDCAWLRRLWHFDIGIYSAKRTSQIIAATEPGITAMKDDLGFKTKMESKISKGQMENNIWSNPPSHPRLDQVLLAMNTLKNMAISRFEYKDETKKGMIMFKLIKTGKRIASFEKGEQLH